jgi:hypothetical protein
VSVDAARVLAARDRILAGPEFNFEPDWRTRFGRWFLERLTSVGEFVPTAVRAVAVVLLLAGIVGALVWLWPRHRRARAKGAPRPAKAPPPRRFAALRAEAAAAAGDGEGRLAEAVRLAWLAALSLLDERGVSAARAARADWEHVEAARRHRAEVGEGLAALAIEFQRTRFGAAAVGRADAERCLALLGRLEASLGAG